MDTLVSFVNNILWGDGQVLIILLVAAGVWFTYSLNFIQLRYFKHMFSIMRGSTHSDDSGISSFQALCTSLSARVGTGNLAGVAVAISLGGPGAIFWMWVIAILGMATGYVESVLGQLYKVRDEHGEFRGGPAYYIKQGLQKPWLAVSFSLCLFFGYGFVFSAVQTNTISDAFNNTYNIAPMTTGIVVALIAAVIVIGGLRRIARFAEYVVPFMGLIYVLVTVGITIANIEQVPDLLIMIVRSAFGLEEAVGGTLAAALKNGIQRGLYSNEAGSGSVPHAAAGASPRPNHPVSQGFVQMLGVFLDTLVLCTCSALIILLAGAGQAEQMEGIRLTQGAMEFHLGSIGGHFVAIAIGLFAFTSVVANYAYGESNLHMFKLDNKYGRTSYTVGYLLMIVWGALASLPAVWAMADMALGLMTVINVTAIIMMTPTIKSISQDYFDKLRQKRSVEYKNGDCKIQGDTEKGIW